MPLLYNPDQKLKEQLIDEFVIRQKEFMMVIDGLLGSALYTSPQHYLVVGQRGMGKTTLLLRIKYAIEDNPNLNTWLIPIKFSEEQYQIATLDRLWEEIADHLEIADPAFDGLLAEMETHEDEDNYERVALDILVRAVKKNKKRALVMIDNLGDLFRKLGDVGNHRLREVLLSHTSLQLIGASSDMLEHTFSYDKPFFEFFQQITLQPISKENSFKLLENLGKQYNQAAAVERLILENPEKIEVLRRLTGGVPRTVALLFGIFIDHQKGSTFEDLLYLLDQVNSFYKHRMDDLKPQQQRIIDALAKAWDPISSKEVLIKSKLGREGIGSNQVSSQLGVLVDNQVVEVLNGRGKIKNYRIRERFFNIWYLMRYGKKQHKEEVLWLVRFLESWCTRKELQVQANDQIEALKLGNYSPQAAYIKTMALYHAKGIESRQKLELLEQTEDYLNLSPNIINAETIGKVKKQELDNLVSELLKKIKIDQKITKDDIPKLKKETTVSLITSITDKLIKEEKSLTHIMDLIEWGIELKDLTCLFFMGIALYDSDPNEAEKYYSLYLEKGGTNAIYNLGLFYHSKKIDIELALKYYLMAIEGGHIPAINNVGVLYKNEKHDIASAEKYYLMGVEKDHVTSIHNIARLYENEKYNIELAEKYYLLAIEKGHVASINRLAVIYERKKGDKALAEKYYLLAIEKGDAHAMYNLALLFENENRDIVLIEKYFFMAIENGNEEAIFHLALSYLKTGRHPKLIEKYLRQSHDLGNINASLSLLMFYATTGRTDNMLQLSAELLNRNAILENSDDIAKIINNILVKKQYYFLLQQFQKPESQLMKYARPMYYVLAWFMRDELPGEYEKTGPEIKETVDEIIQQILLEQSKKEVVNEDSF